MTAHHPDLELARAAAQRDERATRALSEILEREAEKALGRMRFSSDEVGELVQHLRVKLFVEDGGHLDTYDGRGPIAAWFRAMVVHAALDQRRREARRGPARGDSALENVVKSVVDAELAALRSRYAGEFSAAFRAALGELTPRERTILRLVYVDGLTAAQVGKVYGTHRVSVARWLGDVRRKVHSETLARLSHVVTPAEGASLIRLCWSSLDASIARLLADPASE
jgi:RNA polymerase sigma-70 factor (ECF subfamily)